MKIMYFTLEFKKGSFAHGCTFVPESKNNLEKKDLFKYKLMWKSPDVRFTIDDILNIKIRDTP